MNAVWGANTLNLAHTHNVDHTHSISAHSHQIQDHQHYMDHTHTAWVPDHVHGIPAQKFNVGSTNTVSATLAGSNTYGFGGVTIGTSGGSTAYTYASGVLSTINQSGGTSTGTASVPTSGSSLSSSQDSRNASVGIIYLLKVRNTV